MPHNYSRGLSSENLHFIDEDPGDGADQGLVKCLTEVAEVVPVVISVSQISLGYPSSFSHHRMGSGRSRLISMSHTVPSPVSLIVSGMITWPHPSQGDPGPGLLGRGALFLLCEYIR